MQKKEIKPSRFLAILSLCFIILVIFAGCSKSEGQSSEGEQIKVIELKNGDITLNCPKGYTYRDTNDSEIYPETQKHIRKEKVGTFEIVKDEEVVIFLYNRPEGELETQKSSLESLKSEITSDGSGPKGIEFLDEGTDKKREQISLLRVSIP